MKNIAIIGGGYTGLAIAKKLIEEKSEEYKVTIYEKESEVGGIVRTIPKLGTNLDRHYRHIFKSDKYIVDLAEKFGIDIIWPETQMGYFTQNKTYEFGTPISLLKFKPLNFYQKLKFGFGIISLKLKKDWKELEKITATEYINKKYGEKIYKNVWEPLLIAKFGKKKDEISMAWLWGKIALRSSSTSFKGERLGYIKGSYKVLTDALYEHLTKNNCNIKLNSEIKAVYKENEKYCIQTQNGTETEFDEVISTVSNEATKNIYDKCLTKEEKTKLSKLEYSLAKTLIIISKKPLTKFYWINIGQPEIPFGGVIEQTNLLSEKEYQNKHVIYISNYMYEEDKLYKYNEKELFKAYLPSLKKINPAFNENDIEELIICEDKYAQPIIKTNYSQNKMDIEFKSKGLYMANMSQIYPEDRGMNYAVRLGYNVAEKIIKNK